jgi:DNA-binding MarR family transcriptional regulator
MNETSDLMLQNYSLIQQIFLLGDDLDRRLLAGFNLSVSRFNLLKHLSDRGPLTATDLCTLLLCDKANVTRLLDGLEREGLVKRTPDQNDGRRTCITLTHPGETRLQEANMAYKASVINRFSGMSLRDKSSLNETLNQIKNALQKQLLNQ